MNKENNKYIDIAGFILNEAEFSEYVKEEAIRQYEEVNDGEKFDDMTLEEQKECIAQQFEHQLEGWNWKLMN